MDILLCVVIPLLEFLLDIVDFGLRFRPCISYTTIASHITVREIEFFRL